MCKLKRYSIITEKMPREFILLQGRGCAWRKCTFCDYYNDVSESPFEINSSVINKIRGVSGVLDVINSGSAMELDSKTLELLREKADEKRIHTIWFEAHWMYRNKLEEFSKLFPKQKVKYRIGVETFNKDLRSSWIKGIDKSVEAEDIAKYFSGACLLVGIKGQTKDTIKKDIEIALKYFEYFSINVFVENTTNTRKDRELAYWFESEIFPEIKDNTKIEVLINNTDLGVG